MDAQVLLAFITKRSRASILASPEAPIDPQEARGFRTLIQRRAAGEPVAYLRGFVDWWGLRLLVSPDVLVPRPETELLAERAMQLGRSIGSRRIADLGTGSGALAIAMARDLRGVTVDAVDISGPALTIARHNIAAHAPHGSVTLWQGDLLDPLTECPDLVVANLPYLSAHRMETLDVDVRYEPALALFGGPDGLDWYRRLLVQARERRWRFAALFEIDPDQAESLRDDLIRVHPDAVVTVFPDLAGMPRILEARL